jgi:hypothetical protein
LPAHVQIMGKPLMDEELLDVMWLVEELVRRDRVRRREKSVQTMDGVGRPVT